jgi:hypothetical protein
VKPKTQKRRDDPMRLTTLRQLVGRDASKYSAGGRKKRTIRQEPSLPKLKCLETEADG